MTKTLRLAHGGLIDRNRVLNFTVDGKSFRGFGGDTLASALLANGETLVGRSFKYHRPRGIMTAGAEEPNALLTLGTGANSVPNVRATLVPVQEGMRAHTQNAWPSVKFDVGAINNVLSPFLGAGFYYKTFIAGGPYMWRTFEYFIRRAAGLGRASQDPYPARFEKVNAHCDLLIVGGGPAGLSAALSAGRSGARVVLVDEGLTMGSSLAGNTYLGVNDPGVNDPGVNDPGRGSDTAEAWRLAALGELATLPNVRMLPKTTAFGLYDGQVAGLLQRLDPSVLNQDTLTERYWTLRCKKIILATGAIERPIAFAGNDRPGVMLANALGTYARQFAVVPGEAPLIFTNNDSAYAIATELRHLGVKSVTLVDSRPHVPADLQTRAQNAGVDLILGHGIARVRGLFGIEGVRLVNLTSGNVREHSCDVIGVSGGWSPTIHLASHRGTKPIWSDQEQAFLAGHPAPGAHWSLAGAVQGRMSTAQAMDQGRQLGAEAVRSLGFQAEASPVSAPVTAPTIQISNDWDNLGGGDFWAMPKRHIGRAKAFIDFQHDVTTKDVAQAAQEGFLSPEHMKRYTTLGMATDQGKLSNTLGQAMLAKAQNKPMAAVGTTTYRPPFTPVSLGAFVERNTLENWIPERMSPLSPWHRANGAQMIEVADWRRAWFYPRGIEDIDHASRREAFHVRQHVGLCDVSTLGKIEVQGPDAGRLLDLAYVNRLSTLKIGKSRYGLMLREDGVVLDDGTASRLGEDHYFITTTTAEAPHVMAHLEHMVQVEFSDLRVHVTSVSDVWAAMALAGPKARKVLERAIAAETVSNDALPYMGFMQGEIAGHQVRIHRISFSGELAYEIYTSARSGIAVWQALLAVGAQDQIDVYGLEALDLLRIEKGFPTGNEIDGRTTLKMLGLEGMAKDEKDFIGRSLRKREAMVAQTVPTLVGLQPLVPDAPLRAGGQLVLESTPQKMHNQLGYVSSAGYSTTHGLYVGLGFLRGGVEQWQGQPLYVADPLRGQHIEVRVVPPVHVDQEGGRVRG